MKRITPFLLLVVSIIPLSISAQTQPEDSLVKTRPRTVTPQQSQGAPARNQDKMAAPSDAASTNVSPLKPVVLEAEDQRNPTPTSRFLPLAIRTKKTEAERLLKTKPVQTALTPNIRFVTVAALDRSTATIHLITLPKENFLTRGAELSVISSQGMPLTLRVLRANGVNTAVTIFDGAGRALMPLVVEFPIEKGGVFKEVAYYTSAHPGLLSPELVQTGKSYVRSMLDLAAKRLRERGAFISPQIVNVAERLCIVEHIDHDRFRNENRLALYEEIYSLYALNELDTYRYSVSVAGAGGMVQMIPWAYNLMRQRHPAAGLTPDFVVGMRNHSNALQAMLLYMQDTWNDLSANEDVRAALESKTATQTELLAAGYNSNAAKLPSYLRRGGDSWRGLIPRETQMYLQIYKSFESLVPAKSRTADTPAR
jgi:hypothetical protein